MKAFIRSLFIFLLIFSSVGPYLHGKTVHAEDVSGPINLPFKPNDTAIDPNKPVIYATKLGSKTLYAVNFSTGEIKTLTLPYPAERLDFNNTKLYVTQLKMSHDSYNVGPYSGAIAEVDPDSFTLSNVLDINQDPYDIAVDNNGYIYISPGSGQWENIKVYSMKDKKEIVQTVAYPGTNIYEKTNIFYNAETSKVYGIDTTLSPRDIEAFEVVDGMIKNHYDSPYHGDYSLDVSAKLSPDGQTLYNTGGFAFELATYQSGDMTYRFSLGKKYNDFEFSQPLGLTYAASTTTGIDVYQYDTKTFLYSIRKDLSVQKLHIQNGVLVTINKDSSGNYFIETMKADTPPSSGVPVTPGVPDPAGTLNNLGFAPNDTVMDPVKPVLYMTRMGSKTIYSANLSTGEIKSLALPYPAERLEFYNNKLYVTQHKMTHQYVASTLIGAIAEVDAQTFTLTKVIDVDADPYDIAIDKNGYVYISPGSDQWEDMKVYSLATGQEISNTYTANMRAWSYLYNNPETSKVYSITTDSSPRDVDAFEVENGVIKKHYDSPYHGDYPLEPYAEITPDGSSLYNNSGVVFDLAMYQSGDMTYKFKLGRNYADYAFSLQDQLAYAARTDGGIDVYQYNANKYLYTIRKDLNVQKLHFQNGKLTAIATDSIGKHFIVSMDGKTQGVQDAPSTPTTPGTPTDPGTPSTPVPPKVIELLQAASLTWNEDTAEFDYYDDFYNGVQGVELDSFFGFQFNQNIDLKDDTKMMITGPEGIVATAGWTEDDVLYISTGILKGSTPYTLTIKKGAISGAEGQTLANDMVIKFKTASNWEQYDGKWYYYDPEIGDYVTGWKNVSGTWYYFNTDYEMQTGWQKIKNVWYYFAGSGAMKTGWLKLGTTWYYLNGSGAMKTGWLQVGKTWYYFNGSGAMKTGWVLVGKSWYYFYNTGAMAYNTKIGGYKLGPTGAMIK